MSDTKPIPSPNLAETVEQRFEALIETSGNRIRRVCRSWAGSVDANDLEAEVFLQLWRSLPSFGGGSSVDTWAYRVTLNTAMALSRRERLRAQGVDTNATVDELATGSPTEAALQETEQRGALHRAVGQLGDAERSLITLWFEELTYEEIGEVLGISVNLVGVRIHRIKQKLSTLLTPRAQEPKQTEATP